MPHGNQQMGGEEAFFVFFFFFYSCNRDMEINYVAVNITDGTMHHVLHVIITLNRIKRSTQTEVANHIPSIKI